MKYDSLEALPILEEQFLLPLPHRLKGGNYLSFCETLCFLYVKVLEDPDCQDDHGQSVKDKAGAYYRLQRRVESYCQEGHQPYQKSCVPHDCRAYDLRQILPNNRANRTAKAGKNDAAADDLKGDGEGRVLAESEARAKHDVAHDYSQRPGQNQWPAPKFKGEGGGGETGCQLENVEISSNRPAKVGTEAENLVDVDVEDVDSRQLMSKRQRKRHQQSHLVARGPRPFDQELRAVFLEVKLFLVKYLLHSVVQVDPVQHLTSRFVLALKDKFFGGVGWTPANEEHDLQGERDVDPAVVEAPSYRPWWFV